MWTTVPSGTKALLRGFLKRCPLCGGGKLFNHWVKFVERCPTCGFKFEREEGFFMGGWLINLALTEVLLFATLMAYIAKAQTHAGSATPYYLVGIAIALVFPLFFYPFSRTIWAAMELIAVKPTEREQQEALEFYAQRTETASD